MAMMAESNGTERGRGSWGLVLGLILFALMLLVVDVRLTPPAPKGPDAPAAEFSAARAGEVLRSLVGDGSPHPTGSPANGRIRQTILAELERLGYDPQVQEGVSCNQGAACANVRNIATRLEGRTPGSAGKAVLLMAHYDSVEAGPGVGDDLSGVAAVLEVARALKTGPPPEGPVILLLTEGEELGLLGAELFVSRHPWAQEVGTVVNLEARGTAGPSLMFETIGNDAWPVGRYAGAAPRPITNSVYVTIYDNMPNDTDLTVFKNRAGLGYQGLNFAFIENPGQYHTAYDDIEHVSPASLQHHGDNALAAVRALAGQAPVSPPAWDVVFFDVLGFGVVRWPQGWTPVLAVLALVLVGVAVALALRRGEVPQRGLLFGLLGFLGAVVVAALLALGLSMVLRGAMPSLWVADPQPEIAAFWLLALAAVCLLAGAVSRRAGSAGLWAGVWILWAVLGLVVALTAPGISYLFLVPALVAGITGLIARPGGTVAALVPGLVAAGLWMPLLHPLYDGLGKQALVLIGVLAAVLFTTLAPLVPGSGRLGSRLVPLASFVLALVCAGVAFASAPYSKEMPQHLSIEHYQDASSGQASWLVLGSLPPAMRQVARFSDQRQVPYPWLPYPIAFVAPAPPVDLPAPQISVLEDSVVGGKRRLRLLLTSNRQAPEASVVLPPQAKLESARVEGQEVPLRASSRGPASWTEIDMETLRPEGVAMELVLGETQPLDWWIYDTTSGLPQAGEALRKARPATAAPFQDGDATIVSRKVRI